MRFPFLRRSAGAGRRAATEPPAAGEGDTRTRYLADYILRFQPHCDRYLGSLADPGGKSVLVIGSGHGTEMLWAIRGGATEVVGIDLAPKAPDALDLALGDSGIDRPPRYEMHTLGVGEVGRLGRTFDLVVSNNVFEHLDDVALAFRELRRMIEPVDGRIAIFTDPLFYSSHGAHLPVDPWQHLHASDDELEHIAPSAHAWQEYTRLNRMTLVSFLGAVSAADYVILQLFVVVDRALEELGDRLPRIASRASITDLGLEGIGIELMRLPDIERG